MVRHSWTAMAGLRGYVPLLLERFETRADAINYLIDVHEMSRRQARDLRRDGWVELDLHKQGNEYASVDETPSDIDAEEEEAGIDWWD